jgi:hypothetical protein
MFIVRADSPVRGIADLRGQAVVLGTQGSGITVLGRTVLESLGIQVQAITLEKAADGPPMLMDGRAARLGCRRGLARSPLANRAGVSSPQCGRISRILANPGLQAVTLPRAATRGRRRSLRSVRGRVGATGVAGGAGLPLSGVARSRRSRRG